VLLLDQDALVQTWPKIAIMQTLEVATNLLTVSTAQLMPRHVQAASLLIFNHPNVTGHPPQIAVPGPLLRHLLIFQMKTPTLL